MLMIFKIQNLHLWSFISGLILRGKFGEQSMNYQLQNLIFIDRICEITLF